MFRSRPSSLGIQKGDFDGTVACLDDPSYRDTLRVELAIHDHLASIGGCSIATDHSASIRIFLVAEYHVIKRPSLLGLLPPDESNLELKTTRRGFCHVRIIVSSKKYSARQQILFWPQGWQSDRNLVFLVRLVLYIP